MGKPLYEAALQADMETMRLMAYQPLPDSPPCADTDCFACRENKCCILTDTDFGNRKCPFQKTWNQLVREQRTGLKKMIVEGRHDLLKKYRKTLIELGIFTFLDEDIQNTLKELKMFSEEDLKALKDEIEAAGGEWDE